MGLCFTGNRLESHFMVSWRAEQVHRVHLRRGPTRCDHKPQGRRTRPYLPTALALPLANQYLQIDKAVHITLVRTLHKLANDMWRRRDKPVYRRFTFSDGTDSRVTAASGSVYLRNLSERESSIFPYLFLQRQKRDCNTYKII